jgi:glycosyltransferase involved in cell wall biosynthesis
MQEDLMDNISIIIRNRNEGEFIGFALQSCLDFFNKPEIIIVDNNSTDDSLEIVNLFSDRTTIKIYTINNYTPGKSINLGVENATRDTILVLSAHSQILDLDLEEINKQLKKHVAIFGKQIPIYRGKKITPRYIWSHFINKPSINMFSKIENRQFLHNAFCFYNKEFLINNPMPENYPGKEDRYWAIDIVEKGYTYYYTPKIKCNHYYTSNGATWKGIG